MRSLLVIATSVFLMSVGQLPAQTTEGVAQASDPFGKGVVGPNAAASPARSPDSSGTIAPADQSKKPIPPQPDSIFPSIAASRASAAAQRIHDALNRETAFDYLDQPLKDVLEDISFSHEIPIVIDTRALEDFAIDPAAPITVQLKGVSLRSAFRVMFQQRELTYVIRDEVLQVTTPEAAEAVPSTRFYHVAELVPPNGDGEVLVELIKTLVAPKTWCGCEGVGSIIYVEHLKSLAIRQTDEVFHEIEELLAATKKLAEMQPARNIGGMSAFGGSFSE